MFRQVATLALRATLGRYASSQRNLLAALTLFAFLVGMGFLALFEGSDLAGIASVLASTVAISAAVLIGALFCVSVSFGTDIRTTSGKLAATLVTWPLPNAFVWLAVLVPVGTTTALALVMLLPSASAMTVLMLGTDRAVAVTATLVIVALHGAVLGFILAIGGVGLGQRLRRAREAQKVTEIALAIAFFAPGYWIANNALDRLGDPFAAALGLLWPGIALAALDTLGAAVPLVALASLALWSALLLAVATRVAPIDAGTRRRGVRPGTAAAAGPFSHARWPELKLVVYRALRNSSPRAALLFWLLASAIGVAVVDMLDLGQQAFLDLFFLAGLIVSTVALTIRGLSERHRPDELFLGLAPVQWVVAQVVACTALALLASAPALILLRVMTGDVGLVLACASLVVAATLVGTAFAAALAPAPDDAIGTFSGILGYLLLVFGMGLLLENWAGVTDPLRVAFLLLAASPAAAVTAVVLERRRWLADTGAVQGDDEHAHTQLEA